MTEFFKQLNIQIAMFLGLIAILFLLTYDWSSKESKETIATISDWAEKLDRNVKPSGVYIRWESEELPDNDAWGTPLKVYYKNEGVAERLIVSSAGEDKLWSTDDDLEVSKFQINAKGIGEGVRENTAEVAREATKGVLKELGNAWKGISKNSDDNSKSETGKQSDEEDEGIEP